MRVQCPPQFELVQEVSRSKEHTVDEGSHLALDKRAISRNYLRPEELVGELAVQLPSGAGRRQPDNIFPTHSVGARRTGISAQSPFRSADQCNDTHRSPDISSLGRPLKFEECFTMISSIASYELSATIGCPNTLTCTTSPTDGSIQSRASSRHSIGRDRPPNCFARLA
jgi:hypothetical protein